MSDQERDCLTNLRFADDVMLFATSKGQIQNMMCEFKEATEKVVLTIHPDKTKILSNESSMDDIPQIQTGIDIEEIHAQTPPSTLRRHGLSDSLLRCWNMDTEPRTRKNDSIDATQDATPHHSDEKKMQKN